MKIQLHPEVVTSDLPRLAGLFKPSEHAELNNSIENTLKKIKSNINIGSDCEYPPLIGWKRLRFHSKIKIPVGMRADLRIVYREDNNNIQIFAIGKRLVNMADDIYKIIKLRDQNGFGK
jgi:hypothetical protein